MSEERQEKRSEPIMVRVTPSDLDRIEKVAGKAGLKPATLAHMGLLEVVARLEAQAPDISPEEARAFAAAKQRGLKVAQVLTDALEASLAAEAVA